MNLAIKEMLLIDEPTVLILKDELLKPVNPLISDKILARDQAEIWYS